MNQANFCTLVTSKGTTCFGWFVGTKPPPPHYKNKQRVIRGAKSPNQSTIMGLKKLMSGLDWTGKREDS